MVYPEPKRGRGHKDPAVKCEKNAGFSQRLVQQARFVLRWKPALAAPVSRGGDRRSEDFKLFANGLKNSTAVIGKKLGVSDRSVRERISFFLVSPSFRVATPLAVALLAFSISKNKHRHMDKAELAFVGESLATLKQDAPPGNQHAAKTKSFAKPFVFSIPAIAKELGISDTAIEAAKTITEKATPKQGKPSRQGGIAPSQNTVPPLTTIRAQETRTMADDSYTPDMTIRRARVRTRETWTGKRVPDLTAEQLAQAHAAGYEPDGEWLIGRDPRTMTPLGTLLASL
jgi:hypothetical protein